MIELLDIDFYFGKTPALKDINITIKEGEKIVLLGPNGSGKSTLLKIIAGLIFPKKGKYLYNGVHINARKLKDKEFEKTFRKSVQIMFQEPDIMLFNPSVYEEIAFGPLLFGMYNVEERVKRISDLLGITGLLKRPVYLLSGGEKAKVALASILVLEPALLLLDEPTAYLDIKSTKKLCGIIKEGSFTTLVAMHDIHIAKHFGRRFIVISKEHRVVFDGTYSELLKSNVVENYSFFEPEEIECNREKAYEKR